MIFVWFFFNYNKIYLYDTHYHSFTKISKKIILLHGLFLEQNDTIWLLLRNGLLSHPHMSGQKSKPHPHTSFG